MSIKEQIKQLDQDYPILQASLKQYPDNGVLQDQDMMYKIIKKQEAAINALIEINHGLSKVKSILD